MSESLFSRALGIHFEQLHPSLQQFHRLQGVVELHGEVQVIPPATLLGKLIGLLLGSPVRAARGPIRFTLHAAPAEEEWIRHFPGKRLRSRLRLENGRLLERMGPVRLHMDVEAAGGRLELHLRRMQVLGMPAPRWLVPAIAAVETGSAGRIHFNVAAAYPGVGQVVGYQGWLSLPALGDNAAP